jgi:hypothetical protein
VDHLGARARGRRKAHRGLNLTGDAQPVDNYNLTVSEVEAEVQQLTDPAALAALLRYEHNHKAPHRRGRYQEPNGPHSKAHESNR